MMLAPLSLHTLDCHYGLAFLRCVRTISAGFNEFEDSCQKEFDAGTAVQVLLILRILVSLNYGQALMRATNSKQIRCLTDLELKRSW